MPAVAGAAPRQTPDIEVRRNLTYKEVGGTKLKLDAYIPSGGGTRPGVMVIYGGGWVLGTRRRRRRSPGRPPSRASSRSR
jgi:acetyl esterase/lipase